MHFSGAKLAVLLAWGLAGEGAGGRRGLRDGEARDAGRGLAELSEAGEHRGVAAEGVGGGWGGRGVGWREKGTPVAEVASSRRVECRRQKSRRGREKKKEVRVEAKRQTLARSAL